ncbi:MAG: hypothetical protein CV089_14930 [Nitrospira sp. WS110]|nr:hypothetical protein [Nitrospira sp. WS110]
MGDHVNVIPLSESHIELNAYNPWPGLAAYEEASSTFFFGRDDEAKELFRLIRSAPLTIVYGKSGLGKTSLLQAGLYPKLREQHYLPIHVRLQFANIGIASPLQQVMRRLIEEMDREKAEYPQPRDEGSLWEYLHRKDLKIWSHDNFPLTPVLVFDQFEELFTRSSLDDELIKNVMYSLADLIENRFPPDVINEESGTVRSSLDLLSQRYRIVLSFREDFLPEVQAWEQKVPSLLKNYLRLNPMSRERAIEAVACAGQEVLDANVAPSIVDLVGKRDRASDSASLSEMVIEPVLLSLCCSRLNARRTDGTKIDHALVEQTGQDILDGFYREALEDDAVKGSPDVARFIEDNLIQGDHFRGTYPKKGALEKNLLTERQLTALTDKHRLLRIVPHPDTARVELIHDRLVPVVRKARDERKSKQYQEEQERLAREAQAESAKLKKNYRRMGIFALVVAVLAVSCLVLWRVAETASREANTAWQHAEGLLGYLLGEQFLDQVRDMGRSTMLQQVRDQANSYISLSHQVGALVRGLSLRHDGDVASMYGYLAKSITLFEQALQLIESSPDSPDNFDERQREIARTRDRLGEALFLKGYVGESLKHYTVAAQNWERVIESKTAKVEDCYSFAESLVSAGELKVRMGKETLAIKDIDKAVNNITAVSLGTCGRMISNAMAYPDSKALELFSRALVVQAIISTAADDTDDYEKAGRLANEAKKLSPISKSAMRQRAAALLYLARIQVTKNPKGALKAYHGVLADFEELRRIDPANRVLEQEQAAVQLAVTEVLVECHQIKAEGCKSMAPVEEAEITNLKAIVTLGELAEIDPSNMSVQRDLALAQQDRAKVLEARGQHLARLSVLRDSEQLYRASIRDASDTEVLLQVGSILLDQSKALADLSRWSEMKETLHRSFSEFEKAVKEVGTQEGGWGIVGYLWSARTAEIQLLQKARDKNGVDLAHKEVKRLEEQYINLTQSLLKDSEEAGALAKASERINQGAKFFGQGKFADALGEFNVAESAMRKYVNLKPTSHKGYENLRNIYDWIRLTQENLGNRKEMDAAGLLVLNMTRIVTLLKPEFDVLEVGDSLREAQQKFAQSLYDSEHFSEHVDETLTAVEQEVVAAEANVQKHPDNTEYLSTLSNSYLGQSLVRRKANKVGWKEAIRIGIVYLQKAADMDRKNPKYQNELGAMRKYLADELFADHLKEEAHAEYCLALNAYQQAAKFSPGDETASKGIHELAEIGVRQKADCYAVPFD